MSNRLPHARAATAEDGVTDRLADQAALWRRVHRSAEEFNAEHIFVLGDLFDKSLVDAITLTHTISAITEAPCPALIMAGNHDAVNTRGGRFTVEAFGAMNNPHVRYLQTGRRLKLKPWLGFWPVEYCAQDRAREWLANIHRQLAARDRKKSTEVLLLHQSILGCEHVGWKCDDGLTPEEVCQSMDWVFSGHFHTTQTFGPKDRGMYLGAPMHHRFDDEGRPAGYWTVEFHEGGECVRDFVDGGCPRFHNFEWPTATLVDAKRGDYIRITATMTSAEWELTRAAVRAMVDKLNADGFRASYVHKPLYHHATRIKPSKLAKKGGPLFEDTMDAYLDAPEVDKTGLDVERLRRLGREAITSMRGRL
jgi:DNA repair exonuclease SbcCD nuclease subunit